MKIHQRISLTFSTKAFVLLTGIVALLFVGVRGYVGTGERAMAKKESGNLLSYTSSQGRYTLQYPRTYTVTESLSNYSYRGQEYNWYMASFVGETDEVSVTARGPFPGDDVGGDLMAQSGSQGKIIHGKERDRILFSRPDGSVVEVRGIGSAFQLISSTFRFLP